MSTNDAYEAAMEAQQLLGELMDQIEHYLRVTNVPKEQLLRQIDSLLDQDDEFKSNLIDKMSDLLESNNVNASTVVDVARVLLRADKALDASDDALTSSFIAARGRQGAAERGLTAADRSAFHGLPVWVCAGQHQDLVMFLTSDEDGQDVNDCPTCRANVLESYDIYPLWLSDKDPA